jgi:hypothetical protein
VGARTLCYTLGVVKLRLAPLLVLGVVLLALPGATFGGSYVPPPGDGYPVWSPDGDRVAFSTSRGGQGLAVISVDGSGEARILTTDGSPSPSPDPSVIVLSLDWRWAALTRFVGGSYVLFVHRLDGGGERELGPAGFGARPAWSPDSSRVAFRASDGSLVAQPIGGGDPVKLASGGTALAWSPDGTRIAFAGGVPGALDIHVVDADGRNDVVVADGPGAELEPTWSPDGTRLAFLTQPAVGQSFALGIVRGDGSGLRMYEGPDVSSPYALAWTPDSSAVVYAKGAVQGLFRLDLATGRANRLTRFGGAPAVSPDGSRVAFAGGGECRDRTGVYVAALSSGSAVRLTNDCRIVGSAGGDVLRGTPLADVLVGGAGDDRLLARDPGYTGDTLLGGDDDDLLLGGYRDDTLRGGRGRDRLVGGRSADALYGGPGRDRIDGQRGRDVLYAQDRSVDTVRCGTNDLGRVPERDEAWVDRVDRVDADCEVVHRRR